MHFKRQMSRAEYEEFLRKKGLSEEEIRLAVRNAERRGAEWHT
jgi:hypothetical protein